MRLRRVESWFKVDCHRELPDQEYDPRIMWKLDRESSEVCSTPWNLNVPSCSKQALDRVSVPVILLGSPLGNCWRACVSNTGTVHTLPTEQLIEGLCNFLSTLTINDPSNACTSTAYSYKIPGKDDIWVRRPSQLNCRLWDGHLPQIHWRLTKILSGLIPISAWAGPSSFIVELSGVEQDVPFANKRNMVDPNVKVVVSSSKIY